MPVPVPSKPPAAVQLTTNRPSPALLIATSLFATVASVLTVKFDPTAAPAVSNRRARTLLPSAQATTNDPLSAVATAGEAWLPVVVVLTRNGSLAQPPIESKRRATTSVPEPPEALSSVQAITPDDPLNDTAGRC